MISWLGLYNYAKLTSCFRFY